MIEDINLNIWIPAAITLFGFVSYFFGKIISETYPGQEEKSQNYIFGFVFVLIYLLFPLSIIYYFKDSLLFKLNIWWGILFFVLLSFIIKFFSIKQKVFVVNKGQAYGDFEKEAMKKTKKVLAKMGIISNDNYILKIFRWAFIKTPSKTKILILTFIEIFLVANLIYSSNIIFQIIFLILFISSMSNIAQLSIARDINYRNVILEDKNGKKYEGKIIKYGKEFISIRDKRKVYNFIRENVNYVLTEEKLPFEKDKRETKEGTRN